MTAYTLLENPGIKFKKNNNIPQMGDVILKKLGFNKHNEDAVSSYY